MTPSFLDQSRKQRCSSTAQRSSAAQRGGTAERGAAVFIVMMTILLLSGMGMWSMHSASLVDRASGYERTSLQAQYVAEMGLSAATGYLSVPGMARVAYDLGERAVTGTGDTCESVPAAKFCKSLWVTDVNLATSDVAKGGTGQPLIADTAKGTFGPFALGSLTVNEVQGDFTVEMTSPRPAYVPGSAVGDRDKYKLVTLTSYGTVRPHSGSAVNGNLCAVGGSDSNAFNAAAGRIAMRAHTIIGPLE